MENKDRKEKLSPVALILIFSILAAGTGPRVMSIIEITKSATESRWNTGFQPSGN